MTQHPGTAYPPQQPGSPPYYGPPQQYAPAPPPPPSAGWELERVDPVAGTGFGLAQLRVVPITSGLATGSLIAGIASILVSFLVACFGLAGASEGWGGWVAGAFTLLAVLACAGAVAAGAIALRQIRRSGGPGRVRFTGRALALSGIWCAAIGGGIALLALTLSLLMQLA
ncbi:MULTISPECIES: hypothetical protein [Actinoplanes]|uniref:hypothetical protein n=1 Tax=Actinoplanes TaxID=1865 RepID=UPI0012FAE0FD|nr:MULTISPECIES: hypothetical protein [Actinoplanes]GLY00816.1 hypothetical protein Acsp01_11950 [Actinoplanes sp. NBRC 101535]